MRILFLSHAYNSLTQRLFIELQQLGHEISVEFDINDQVAIEAVELYQPDVIIAPFLKRAIPEVIWSNYVCLIVHPGICGDRGPSALDWAILNNEKNWGLTVLQANAEMDAGDIWAYSEFTMRAASKASLYHNEITEAAVQAIKSALYKFQQHQPAMPLENCDNPLMGTLRPLMQQQDRSINWLEDNTATILRKVRCADGFPGIRDSLFGRKFFIYDVYKENKLRGKPAEIIARCEGAVCRATIDGAVWIGHLREKQNPLPFKLPATLLLASEVSELDEVIATNETGYRDIWYEQQQDVGYLYFPFYNGAMGVKQCQRLRLAYINAKKQDTRVIVLMGGPEYWSNGMHLNLIEAAASAADESWLNIQAIDDLALEIINSPDHLTISALQGNAGAGGVFLARAADYIWAREGIVLNPHYKDMGNLYGSEYWSYLLPRYTGAENAQRISQARLPMGTKEALSLGLIDAAFESNVSDFEQSLKKRAANLANMPDYAAQLTNKQQGRIEDEKVKSLQTYRDEELERMHKNFYGFDPSYHIARYNFVYKVPKSRTPLTIAMHRRNNRAQRSSA
ncbi:MAG: hydrogenase maturation protein [Pseudomonadota bacterium]